MNLWIVLPSLVLVAVLFVLLPVAAAAFTRYRQTWRVPCPVKRAEAQIGIDPLAAARDELLGRRQLTVARCSFWPEQQGCAQRCVDVPLADWKPSSANHKTLTPA